MYRIVALLICVAVLPGCSEDIEQPCGDCPEASVDMDLLCDPCEVDLPIQAELRNKTRDRTFATSICDWKLVGRPVGATPFVWEDIYRLDCSRIFPLALLLEPGDQGILVVEIDPAVVPLLDAYDGVRLVVEVRDPTDGEKAPFEMGVRIKLL